MMRATGPRKAPLSWGPDAPSSGDGVARVLRTCRLAASLAVLVGAIGAGLATWAAGGAQAAPPGICVVHSLPSFVAQGELGTTAEVADIVEVHCDPFVYGTESKIRLTADQLFSRCAGDLSWYAVNPFAVTAGRSVTVELDPDGNATAALLAGPGCAAGESLITAHMEEEPFESFTTAFAVLPPRDTPPGVVALPSPGTAAIVEAEYAQGSEKQVHIGSEELFDRCRVSPHLRWVRMNREIVKGSEVQGVELDNNGNAFVLAIAGPSCTEGVSLIEADLESKPFTTFTTNFDILPLQPIGEAAFTIEKLQQIQGTGSGFTKVPLTGAIGETVNYEIVVTNTGTIAETLSEFSDAKCDPGTLHGGPGSSPLEPGESTTYTCDHLLSAPGVYTNEATVTGTAIGGTPVAQSSNRVIVAVPPTFEHSSVLENPAAGGLRAATGSGSPATGKPRSHVLEQCIASRPLLHGASGAKHGVFTVDLASAGIKQITFYVDGHKLKTLNRSQARHGRFTLQIDPRKLSYGAHRVSVSTIMSNPDCARIAVANVFVHARTARAVPKFTG